MAVRGKQKGNSFERRISNILSERFKEYTGLEKSFRRNIDSGSFFGGSNQIRTESYDLEKATFGDIVIPNLFKFSIECKHYKTPPSFKSIVKQDIKDWDEWIRQAEQDSEKSQKKFSLIVKYNNVDIVVFLREEDRNCDPIMYYKGYPVVTLDDWLAGEDTYFFEASEQLDSNTEA